MSSQYDFVIIGAGAHGLATAYELAKLKAESVLVVDGASVAGGASGGFGQRGVRANRRDLREVPLMREANEAWPHLSEELGADTGYKRTGGAYLIDGPAASGFKGIEAAETYARAHTDLGIPTEVWDTSTVKKFYPGISEEVHGASYVPSDGVASHEATTLAYRDAASRLGVEIRENTEVSSIAFDSNQRVTAITTTNGQTIKVRRQLVLASNGGTQRLVEKATGISLPLWTIYPQASRLKTAVVPEIPMLTGHETRSLSVKLLDGDIMLSGGWRGVRTTTGSIVSNERLERNIAVLRSVFPYLDDLQVLDVDVSRAESASVDQIPIIGKIAPNLYVESGWSGHGWALVPAVARHVARAILTNSEVEQLNAFSPRRFNLF